MHITADFEYANHRLSDFGCIMCNIDSSSGVQNIEIGCNITFTTIKNKHSSIHSITSSSYEEVYTTTFDIMNYNCNDKKDIYMTSLEVRSLMKWLNRRDYHKFRLINGISDESNVFYYGSFNVQQLMLGDKIIGLRLVFTGNAPFGFSDNIDLNFILTDTKEFEIYGDSDELGVIYPTITVRALQDGNIKITNKTTNTYVYITNCKQNEVVTIDGEHKIITTSNKSHTTLPNDFNYEYFSILVDEYDSPNIYQVSSPCEISVKYIPVRKVGVG